MSMPSKPCKEYACDYGNCTNKYKTKYSLKRHYLSHMGVKQHKCSFCDKRFSLSQYLQEHMYIHTGEKPFTCKFPSCGRKFRQAGKLSIHKKEHNFNNIPESGSQGSTNMSDANAQAKVVKLILGQIAAFQLPGFFYSKILPVPPQMQMKISH